MKPIVVKDFAQLNYALKAGHAPVEQKKPHKGNWQLEYNGKVIDYNFPYAIAVEKKKLYSRFGNLYPDKLKFKITPYLIK